MLKKKILTNLMITGLLITASHAMELEREKTSIALSVKKLEKGYNLGLKGQHLELKDGTKWLIQNRFACSMPNFWHVYTKEKFQGIHDQHQKMFYFTHSVNAGFGEKWNEELQRWEIDYSNPGPMIECFNLTVKQIIEEKAAILEIEEKKPQHYINIGNMEIPCVWNPETQQMVLDFSSMPQAVSFLNAKFSPNQEKTPAVLQLENGSPILNAGKKEPIEKTSPFTIIKEPNHIEIEDTTPHVLYDDTKQVWIVTERITPVVKKWLKTRLSWDAYLQFNKTCDQEIQRDLEIPQEHRELMINAQNKFAQAMGYRGQNSSFSTLPPYVLEAQSFMRTSDTSENLYLSKEYEGFTKLYDQSSYEFSGQNDNYLSAWRGFDYNLDHSHEVPTYVSCILSQPFENKSIIELSPFSVDVQMLMTGTLSENFYCPLGIYASPIARLHNRLNKNINYKNLSLIIHKGMANALGKVNPNIQVGIVRPIHSMATILKKSNIPFTISKGYEQKNINMPYIRSFQPIEHRWYSEDVKLVGEEKEQFGDSLFTLIDPRTNKFYQIDNKHHFSQSPFLGGISRENIEAFPFFTIDVNDF